MVKKINNYILYYNSDITVNNSRTLPYGLNHLLLYTTYCFILKLFIIIYKSIHLFKNIFLIYLGIFILLKLLHLSTPIL